MKGLWHTMAPFATDVSGACTVFQHAAALVIAQDSNGAVSNLRRVIDLKLAAAGFETIDLPEFAYTLGREEEFQNRMHELLDIDMRTYELFDPRMRGKHEFVVLVNGPVANLLGTDLGLRSRLFEESSGLPVIWVQATGNKNYDKGIAAAYDSIYERFVQRVLNNPPTVADIFDLNVDRLPADAPCVNIIGHTELDWPGKFVFAQLFDSLRDEGERILCTCGYRTSDDVARWKSIPRARRNIVTSAAGLKFARRLEDEAGIPFTTIDELTCFDPWAEGLALRGAPRVLVVGEHLSSRLLRRLLFVLGAGDVDIATFFTLDRKLRDSGEFRLTGESDLIELFAKDDYDLVIGDAVFEKLCPAKYHPLMHPPVGYGARDGSSLSRKWLEELCEWWNMRTRGAGDDETYSPEVHKHDFSL